MSVAMLEEEQLPIISRFFLSLAEDEAVRAVTM